MLSLGQWCSVVLVAFSISIITANNEIDEIQRLPLSSVLRREKDVFASNAAGLYRAELSGRSWKQLPIPDSMPVNGRFANQPINSTLVLYYTSKWMTNNPPKSQTKINGLYLSQDDGQTWRLISDNDDYGPVFLHPNGDLFAVTNSLTINGPARVLISKSLGEDWRDITGNSFGQISYIFADPDHPDLICLGGNSMRNYIFQATDANYEWKATREWEWWPRHMTEEIFFSRNYSTRTTLYLLDATLLNYFAYDFGNRVYLPGFDIIPQKSAYEFSRDQAKVVEVSIPFLPEPRTIELPEKSGQGPGSKRGVPKSIKIVDQKDGLGLWGLNIVGPDGKRTHMQASVSKSVYQSKDRDKTKQELRKTGGLEFQEITHGNPYKRGIDLGQLYNFYNTGTYRVQLEYENIWLEDPVQDEWIGSFRGQVFTVTIR